MHNAPDDRHCPKIGAGLGLGSSKKSLGGSSKRCHRILYLDSLWFVGIYDGIFVGFNRGCLLTRVELLARSNAYLRTKTSDST